MGNEREAAQADTKGDAGEAKPEARLTEREPVRTRHAINIDGRDLAYTVTAGAMPLRDEKGEIEAEIFFMAYTVDPDGDQPRPLTFAFNGGPGSSSIWLHMGALGPRRVVMHDDGTMPAPPFRLIDNEETWLSRTDLVFIDPVGTGFSRGASQEVTEKFWGYKGDVDSISEFIRLYLTRYERWLSPLFLAGESYGTLRAGGLAGKLTEMGIALNGIVLISAILSYLTVDMWTGQHNDLPFALFLPSFTATAWFHQRLPDDLQRRPLREVLAEVESWATSEYLLALVRGDQLPEGERRELVRRLARYSGLSPEYIENTELRVQIHRFCKELLRDQKRTVGRIDSRYTGIDVNAVTDVPDYDPSMAETNAPFTATFNAYVRNELGYTSPEDRPYAVMNGEVNQKWKFDQSSQGRGSRTGYLETGRELRKAMVRNPYLQVLVAYGYYDLATPYHAIRYTVDHLGLGHTKADRALRDNVHYADYESGHMMYVDTPSRGKLRDDIGRFIDEALAAGQSGGRAD